MNPENYVSIGFAWLLKGIGFPQTCDACFDMFDTLTANKIDERSAFDADAPTVSELFAALPIPSGYNDEPFLYTGISRTYKDGAEKFFCKVSNWKSFTAETMPDAVAKAILALVKAKKLRFMDLPTDAYISRSIASVTKANKKNRKQEAQRDLQFMQALANVGGLH